MSAAWQIEHAAVAGHPAVLLRFARPETLHAALRDAILDREPAIVANTPSTQVASLPDGLTTHWQHFNVLTWPDPACETLREAVLSGCRAWLDVHGDGSHDDALIAISCWANALRGDERLGPHHHAPAMLLGNYLVDDGGGSGGGTLYFANDGAHERLQPEPGRLVICPGHVRHAVERHTGHRPRLSIAFDAFVRRQNPLLYLGAPDAMAPFTGPRWLTLHDSVEEID
jgi:hypothetical protein